MADDERTGLATTGGDGPSAAPAPIEAEALPQIGPPPQTKAPVQVNTQVNIYQQIPQSAWDRLNSEQIVDLSKVILQAMEASDKRQFDYAIDQAGREESTRSKTLICGSLIAIIGFGLTAYLAMQGHEMIAVTISLPLATILAIIVGNKIIGA